MRRFKWVGDGEPIAPTRSAFLPQGAGSTSFFVEIDDATDAGKREAEGVALNANYSETQTSLKQQDVAPAEPPIEDAAPAPAESEASSSGDH